VVFISSEIEEVVRLSHRIAVLKDHHKIGEIVNGPEVTVERIVELIAEHETGPAHQAGAEVAA
jgi:simple sugar transport system ATP-binding protein